MLQRQNSADEEPKCQNEAASTSTNRDQQKRKGKTKKQNGERRRTTGGGLTTTIQRMGIAETDAELEGVTFGGKGVVGILERLIRRRFVLLLLGLVGIALVLITVIVVVVLLLGSIKRMNEKYSDNLIKISNEPTKIQTSEQFMRFYEQLMRSRISPYMTTNSMISKISSDQLESAKAAGILPLNDTIEAKVINLPPVDNHSNATSFSGFRRHEWHDPKCTAKCEKDDISIPPLVVISLDGFAQRYLDLDIVQTLHKMGDCGASAKFLFPSYPSKTFPNHYTIATGLWPGTHGIIDNAVFDPEISPRLEEMKDTKNAAYYRGEPIWSIAVRQHKRVFCLFWAGCSFNITGAHNPTIDLPYNKSFPYSKRVDKIVEWLTLPAIERPSLIMAYFDQPDDVGHYHTSDSQVELELVYMESVLDYLFTALKRESLLDCVNLIILSDHGMQRLDKHFYFNELLSSPNSEMLFSGGVIGHIYLPNSTNITTDTEDVDQILEQLVCFDKTKFHLYDRHRMPIRYHYARDRRVGDVIFDARLGVTFYPNASVDFNLTSDHGYDYLLEPMHTIFFAQGPNIRPGARVEPFQNVELLNLFTDLLRLPHDVPNNGTLGVLDGLLQNMDLHRSPIFPLDSESHPLSECSSSYSSESIHRRHLVSCAFEKESSSNCDQKIKALQDQLDKCSSHRLHPPYALFYSRTLDDLCMIDLCPAMVLTSSTVEEKMTTTTIVYEQLDGADFPESSTSSSDVNAADGGDDNRECLFIDTKFDKNCGDRSLNNSTDGVTWKNIAAAKKSAASAFARLHFPMHTNFANGAFRYLQNITRHYARRYGHIVSITGTIYVKNDMDRNEQIKIGMPTHFFRILIRCEEDQWHLNGINCRNGNDTRVLTFILPNARRELNCLDPPEYLLVNTARIRDVELLSRVEFFAEQMWFPIEQLRWRTNITTQLWD